VLRKGAMQQSAIMEIFLNEIEFTDIFQLLGKQILTKQTEILPIQLCLDRI